jgi:uncharacterized protein YndB with AHSA1/START domain
MDFLLRLLKVLVALVLLAAVFFWFAARRGDRGNIEQEITIDRPASVVFRWIGSDELQRRWLADLSGNDGPKSAGATSAVGRIVKVHQTVAGKDYVFSLRAVQVVPNELIQWDLSCEVGAVCHGAAIIKLASTGDYTRVTFSSHTEFFGWMDRTIEPVLTYAVRRKLHDDFLRLKWLVEAEPASR